MRITCSHTIINYHLSQKFELLGNGKFKHLIINLTPLLFFHHEVHLKEEASYDLLERFEKHY